MKRLALLALFVAATAMAMSSTDVTGGPAYNAPPGANPALGSVIQSWNMSSTSTPYALGGGRDATYAYGVFYGSPCFLRSYTTAGSVVGSVTLSGFSTSRGPSEAHLGTGYMAISEASGNIVRIVNKATGATTSSFGVTPAGGGYLLDCGFNGTYYFAAGGSSHGTFNVYTTGGSSAGSWTASGASGIASTGGYDSGTNATATNYMMIFSWNSSGTNFLVTYPAGTAVGSFAVSGCNANGIMMGPSSLPATYGWTAWANLYTGSQLNMYEIDLGFPASGVAPTSIGHVKALYR